MNSAILAAIAVSAAILGVGAGGSARAEMRSAHSEFDRLTPTEMTFIDRIAAAYFEDELRLAQTNRIQRATAEIYRSLPTAKREAFREERRRAWRGLTEAQKRIIRNAKRPIYDSLTSEQKAPFRRAAYREFMSEAAAPSDALAMGAGADI